MAVFCHFPDKGNGGTTVDPVFAFVANSTAIFDTDRESLPVKFVKNREAWLNYAHRIQQRGEGLN